MRTIIAGSRSITSMALLEQAIERSGFAITEVITGGAHGVDFLGHTWAKQHGIPARVVHPDWRLGRKAGPLRNEEMAKEADALIAVWDGKSRGTRDMIRRARKHGLKVYVEEVKA